MSALNNVDVSLVSMKARYQATEPSTLVAELLCNVGSTRCRFEKSLDESLDGAGSTSPLCKDFLEKYHGGPGGSSRSSEAVLARYASSNVARNNRALLVGFGLEDGSDGFNRGVLGHAGEERPGMAISSDGAANPVERLIADWRRDVPSSVAEQRRVTEDLSSIAEQQRVTDDLPKVVGVVLKPFAPMVVDAEAMMKTVQPKNVMGDEGNVWRDIQMVEMRSASPQTDSQPEPAASLPGASGFSGFSGQKIEGGNVAKSKAGRNVSPLIQKLTADLEALGVNASDSAPAKKIGGGNATNINAGRNGSDTIQRTIARLKALGVGAPDSASAKKIGGSNVANINAERNVSDGIRNENRASSGSVLLNDSGILSLSGSEGDESDISSLGEAENAESDIVWLMPLSNPMNVPPVSQQHLQDDGRIPEGSGLGETGATSSQTGSPHALEVGLHSISDSSGQRGNDDGPHLETRQQEFSSSDRITEILRGWQPGVMGSKGYRSEGNMPPNEPDRVSLSGEKSIGPYINLRNVSGVLRPYLLEHYDISIGEGGIHHINAGRKVLNRIRKSFKVLWQRIRHVSQRIWHPKATNGAAERGR
ncbi:hypothetical protein [Herbaspirillum sp. SJZ099]|uniref:hypothetical protein n=1 Tax=Herbaspirillum sp. SJZ099 TaxID=2572916 RepID=UPI00119E3DB0|nr:hypothetical protein [Herbaspirillum sp. SJZ099]TWC66598.1 hypothetical protein FB597_105184 [Herbaspirillum sp. SJZ099]